MSTTSSSPGGAWWRDRVIYQIYPKSFADSNGDGVGDLVGVRERIDHLRWLGVGAVWLSPFFPSGGADNGYDVTDYRDVDPTVGSLDDFDALVAALHRRDIRVVIDQVYNHTSDEHPWFVEARSGADVDRRDWYIWRPPRDGFEGGTAGAEPNDWRSFFGGPAWTFDPTTGEYYLHLFHHKQPDLNWENEEVRRAVHDTMRWWLARGVDGFRLDVINLISKPPGLPDAGRELSTLQRVANGPRLHEYLAELRTASSEERDRPVLIGEMPGATTEVARDATDPARDELDMVIHFDHVEIGHVSSKWDSVPVHGGELGAVLARWESGLADTGWSAPYLTSHDQPRAVSRFGDTGSYRARAARALATLLLLHRGTPIVYQGDEVAMGNHPFASLDDVRDVESVRFARAAIEEGRTSDEILALIREVGRDNSRTPMQWNGGTHAGFGDAPPWIDVNPDHSTWNVEQQRDDPGSVLHHVRRLIELRRRVPTIASGTYEPLLIDHPQVYAFARRRDEERLVVVINLSSERATIDPIAGTDDADIVHAEPEVAGRREPGALAPWEWRIYRSS